ncbi:KICSTOR complex protein SZT2 isoform X2 [Cephus cinctus]|uniref:KICSTOR complex protein SZT2 isoform X2 n=1 Tax=Cephus cinctus TaxID=211228 RepID=A0AAJ7W397_CEPCN|nr:KICSTOR complex protein SZT2 isoform X2 [Cephus cinctus]
MDLDIGNEEQILLEADTVYLLMKKGFPISRNVRVQWMLEHLESIITIQHPDIQNEEVPELEIVSVLPRDMPASWRSDNSYLYQYKITTATSLVFLAHKYRMAFSLDLSPSLATVDIQHGEIVIDEVYLAMKQCLECIVKPFIVPGSKRIMQPEIYITIIAHTPFFTSPAQQVLVQGWLLTVKNIEYLIQYIEQQLKCLEEKVALVTGIANQQLETLRAESERLVGGLFEEGGICIGQNNSNNVANISMVSPEASFINMLRYGILALALLPEHSCAHLVVVSDGIVGVADVHVLDSVLQQLRASTVACTFIHVGSTYHPHCAEALVPYPDLLRFLARATLGSYMTFIPQPVPMDEANMNLYQQNFLCWHLYRDNSITADDMRAWYTENTLFHSQKSPQLLRKKQIDDKVTCTLSSLLCCRLREGYLIKRVTLRDGYLELCFVLPWKTHVFLEYLVTCQWPPKSLAGSNTIQYTITIEAPYEFLHDITCLSKKPLKSQYRQSVVSRFWIALSSLTESDNMLSHFSWFPGSGWPWYSVPDTIKSGMPVFYLPTYPSVNTILLSDAACPQFGQIWQPVVSLDPLQWARWMHSQRVTLVLSHDRPLPRHLHQANQSGRFQCVQCRQAAASLYAMLKNWATFVLVENHTYVQFIYREMDKPPVSFSLIRVSSKALCVVLNVAFAGGTEGVVRHNVVVDLVDRLSKLTLPNRPTEQREIPCCTIVHKPLERILIRYERMPTDLSTVVFPDGTQPTVMKNTPIPGGSLTTTLSRYLYHSRWLWLVKKPLIHTIPDIVLPRLNTTAIARILSTITKIRLAEGFSFAYSAAGIINMVLEVQMQGPGVEDLSHPCIIQYVLFPPHKTVNPSMEQESGSEEDTDEGTGDGDGGTEDNESCGDFQIVTEVWIEPQCGRVQLPIHQTAEYMHPLYYHQIPDAIAQIDEECVNALLTLEHLSLLSQVIPSEKLNGPTPGQQCQGSHAAGGSTGTLGNCNRRGPSATFHEGPPNTDQRIHLVPFTFEILNILPKCQQAELLFSMFNDDPICIDENNYGANGILMEGFLEHVRRLHNKELFLTPEDSENFTEMLLNRSRDNGPPFPFSIKTGITNSLFLITHKLRVTSSCLYRPYFLENSAAKPQWRCFIKGISVTHVIVTMLPASAGDVRLFISTAGDNDNKNYDNHSHCTGQDESIMNSHDLEKKDSSSASCIRKIKRSESFRNLPIGETDSNGSSQCTTAHSTPKANPCRRPKDTPKQELILPIYVYDCSLAVLIDALVEKLQSPRAKDIYQNHTFKVGEQFGEDFVNLKSGCDTKPSSPEPKSEDSDNIFNDQRSLTEHCKLLSLAHCKCYVVAVYKSLALQHPLSYEDMEAAVDQCEEHVVEINVTKYFQSVCRHLSSSSDSGLQSRLETAACNDVQPLHNLIKDKFERIMTVAFRTVPAHPEFYYCSPSWTLDRVERLNSNRTDSDDELEGFTFHSESMDCKADNNVVKAMNATWPATNLQDTAKLSSRASTGSLSCDFREDDNFNKEHPLFLQLNCSIHSKSNISSVPVKLLPTCFTEIVQRLDDYEDRDPSYLKITLDIMCLNLPKEVLEVSLEHNPGLRTTSYCSGSPLSSTRTDSESSPGNDIQLSETQEPLQERIPHLPLYQHNAIANLTDEIEWLLQDETATALLDQSTPSEETLNFVARHVSESHERSSCHTDKVPLHFVFPAERSVPKFLAELKKLEIDRYCMRPEGDLFYFAKNPARKSSVVERISEDKKDLEDQIFEEGTDNAPPDNKKQEETDTNNRTSRQDSGDPSGCHSEISSLGEGPIGTDDGYEGDSSNSEDDCHWLADLDKRRILLPNFWLILKVQLSHVDVYFHCRFLELASPEVDRYRQIQKMVVSQIKAICRRVNQYLLLQNLHDTRICDPLLEPESTEDHNNWRGETGSESGSSLQNHNPTSNATPGLFRCPVIWEVPFCLHPRLKTGPGKSGLSRGIKALHGVLNRFSVNNRNNMFVYQEPNENVFYLRLHEQTSEAKCFQNKLSESDERLVVSRSSSVASLSQSRCHGSSNDQTSADDSRPRVRSFGEKECDILNKSGDSIILMVHGISEAGQQVKCGLVQVLQNRLDDAVLEVLSGLLARNPMCKLTPADVHFIQRPFKSTESIVQLSVQPHCLPRMDALGYYLRQNILQFLHIPKYTDPRSNYHFQDYFQPEGSDNRVSESDIFLYNQSQSSGSRGIACIALAIVNSNGDLIRTERAPVTDSSLPISLKVEDFEEIVSTSVYEGNKNSNAKSNTKPEALIEFRIWKQGRVNLESLIQKLRSAVKHATWDLVTEYNLLPTVLTEPLSCDNIQMRPTVNKETQTPIKIKTNKGKLHENIEINHYEYGEEGKLHEVYHMTLAYWFQFALEIGVPAVKKHVVVIQRRHPLPVVVKELQNLIRSNAPDTTTKTFVLRDRQPFLNTNTVNQEDLLNSKPFKASESMESINIGWLSRSLKMEVDDSPVVYIPCDLSRDDHSTFTKCILVARNFYQWKASFGKTVEPDLLGPKDQKLVQKFNPLILDSKFVPRQRFLLARVQSDNIILYMYNWSKERSEILIKQATKLGTWLTSRSSLFSSIIMQKLGVFYHQPMQNYQQGDRGSFQYYQITDMDTLTKFSHALHNDSKEWSKPAGRGQSGKNTNLFFNNSVSQVLRDAKPSPHHSGSVTDPVIKAANDFQELRHQEKKSKEDLKRLSTLWQSRGATPNIPISLTTLNTFKQHSRLIHYCHSPLLFLPNWRLQSAATRDHSLTPPPNVLSNVNLQPQSPSNSQYGKSGNGHLNDSVVTEWHQELCDSMLSEYKQYLEVLGFNPVQVESNRKTDGNSNKERSCYLQKSMLGGVLLFEINLAQPFFIVKLHIVECSRLQTKTSSALVNQFMLSFVDACDKIKINMHLHSFTYDFHLRCIHSYIAGSGHWSLRQGYHLTHFLDDFNKYYSKAPNYARNLVYSDAVTLTNLATPARTLYQYLLSHEKAYGMQVFGMSGDSYDNQDSEFSLVRLQSTPLISYCDAQDMKHTDDFDVTLIVTRLEQPPQMEKTEITLKYYLMLTSKRELYPKREVENNKLGKFRTVYNVVKSTSSHADSSRGSSPVSLMSQLSPKNPKIDSVLSSSEFRDNQEITVSTKDLDTKPDNGNDVNNTQAPTPPPVPSSPLTQTSSIPNVESASSQLVQIRQESVNYLGYYSSHEQVMQQMIMSQAQAAREHIMSMVERGALHCRTHLLWNKLLENKSTMSYAEFMELRSLARVEPLSVLDSRLSPLINQPVTWYQTLSKVLQNKYQEHHKQFNAPDGNVTHHLVLPSSYLQAFMMLTIDLHTSRGDLYVVYRNPAEVLSSPFTVNDVYHLVEGFVNACCFHLWMGLYSQ